MKKTVLYHLDNGHIKPKNDFHSQSIELKNLKMVGITKGLFDYIRRRKSVFETLSEKEIEESLASLGVS